MAKYVRCRICGERVAKNARVCPHCGARRRKKKKPLWLKIVIGFFVICVLLAMCSGPDEEKEKDTGGERNAVSDSPEKDDSTKDAIDTSFDTSGYLQMSPETLFDYSLYMAGKNVVTAFEIADVDSGILKAKTDNNDGYFFSVACYFDDRDVTKQFEEGEKVTVAGVIRESDPDSLLSTPTATMDNCTVIGHGEIIQELSDSAESQKQTGEQFKQEYEESIAKQAQADRDDYISQCETVSYSDVERNPDTYDGKYVKISGKVVQVMEGFFDSVTMRIDCDGNMWYVTYARSDGESRILEGDRITCYGECDGVESYTSLIGQVTIPSMKMKYYE